MVARICLQVTFIFVFRPRKVGAKFTGAAISHDEFSQPTLTHDWEMKRDRWGSGHHQGHHGHHGHHPDHHHRHYCRIIAAMIFLMSTTIIMGPLAAPFPRWNGYDAREYKEVIEEHKKLEDARREVGGLLHLHFPPHGY